MTTIGASTTVTTVEIDADEFNCVQRVVSSEAQIPMGTVLDSVELETIARRVQFVFPDTSNCPLKAAKGVVRAYLNGHLRICTGRVEWGVSDEPDDDSPVEYSEDDDSEQRFRQMATANDRDLLFRRVPGVWRMVPL